MLRHLQLEGNVTNYAHLRGRALVSMIGAIALISACSGRSNRPSADPFVTPARTDAVFATFTCESQGTDGKCTRMSCTADREFNCKEFAKACIDGDYNYSGTGKKGTCSR